MAMPLSPATLRARLAYAIPPGEMVSLAGALVEEPLALEGLELCSFDLSGAVFRAPVSFRRARLTGLSWFKDCTFDSGADFTGTAFGNDARFDRARFGGALVFAGAEVQGAADFNRCRFAADATFDRTVFSGNLSFEAARFSRRASLRQVSCLGGLWLEGTEFEAPVETQGLDVHGRTWLKHLKMPGGDGGALAGRITSYGYQWV